MKKKNSKNKIIKLNKNINFENKISSIKFIVILAIILIIFVLLFVRLFFLQFVDGKKLEEMAYTQQSTTEVLSAKRGNIYDTTGIPLAISSTMDSVYVYPSKFKEEKKADIAQGLSELLSMSYDEILAKIEDTSSSRHLLKTIQNEDSENLKTWLSKNYIIDEVQIEEKSQRYYPYNSLASSVIGSCGTDKGLSGIEYAWDSVLTGTSGKSVSSQDINKSEIPNSEESYIPAENGYDVTLTIDVNIQSIVEKYLQEAIDENKCVKGGTTIVMDPSNGEILAMATCPTFDLNSPFTPNYMYSSDWDTLSVEEKNTRINQMWKNKCISDTYEPGSVFKVITASVALEENITETDKAVDFNCTGSETFKDGTEIKCWRWYAPHGSETLRQALCNSCNPAFMQLARRITAPTLYKYYKAFGFFDKTNVSLSGESSGIFYDLDKLGPVELSTMSFGQRITITPLQMASSLCTIANDGVMLQPKIVKEIKNTDTGEITKIETKEIRQVLSKETSEEVKGLMESVISIGTGGKAAVKGYSIGGKTGTSEPIFSNLSDGYIVSFGAVAPVENTKIVLLTVLYDPQGKSHQGGQVAAPVASKMLSEILPYLGIEPTSANETTGSSSQDLY